MPPSPTLTSTYFPPLDKCLTGDGRLISWKTAYRALNDLDNAFENTTLEEFLTDPDSIQFLSNALDPYLQPGAKTKADFETKTAPIHVSQSSNGDYDLEELKKDALWLSEKVDVEELVALRVVILEWQQRAQDQLLAAVTSNGNAEAASQAGLSVSTLKASTARMNGSVNAEKKAVFDFSTEEIRRNRQLEVYLEEKSYLLKTSTELVSQVAIKDKNPTRRKWIEDLAEKIAERQCRTNDAATHEAFCTTCIEAIDSMLTPLLDPAKTPQIFKSDEAKAIMLEAATFSDIITAMRMLLANISSLQTFPGYNTVSAWFKLMAKMNFFQNVVPSPALPSVDVLQSLSSIISVMMLHIPETVDRLRRSYESMLSGAVQYPQLDGEQAYYTNEACFREINLIFFNAAQENVFVASPAIFGWSIIASLIRDIANLLRERREQQHEESSDGEHGKRRASRRDSREEFTIYEKLYMHMQDLELEVEAREDPVAFFARVSVDTTFAIVPKLSAVVASTYGSELEAATSFHSRRTLLSLVGEGMLLVSYGAEVLEAVLGLLSPDAPGRYTALDTHVVDDFLSNDVFRETVLEQALARYPFELSPLLRLLTVLAPASNLNTAGPTNLVEQLERMQTLTVMVTEDFRDYALENEDENINSMVLTRYVPLFASKQALEYGVTGLGQRALTIGTEGEEQSNVLAIPAGAAGSVVKESRPLVFRLEHEHSALEYLGLLLCTILPNSEFVTAPFEDTLDRSTAAEIITLITALVEETLKQHQGVEEVRRRLLGRLSYALPESQDIVSVIADILEMELLSHLNQSYQEGSLELLIASAEFLDQLTGVSPERVWSLLARSSLLGLSGGVTALAAVVGGTEVQTGRFRFLKACVSFYSHLINDAIAGLVKRRAKMNKISNRFDSTMPYQDTTPERTMTMVINAYQTVMMDAWQNLGEWRFSLAGEKIEVTSGLVTTFTRLLVSTYGVAGASAERGISSLLFPAAKILLDAFNTTNNGSALQTFGMMLPAGYALSDRNLPAGERRRLINQMIGAYHFLATLIRVNRMVDSPNQKTPDLGRRILKLTPYLASLQSIDLSLRRSTSTLMTELVLDLNNDVSTSPPSLLGQLSTEAGKNFLAVITQLDRPLKDLETECEIWNFLSTVMGSKQQWFAIYLLTGALPKDRLKNHDASNGKSILTYALDQLSDISEMEPERAKAILKFIVSAQSAWAWATTEVRSHHDFFKKALGWMNSLAPPTRKPNIAEELILANEHQMAAYLCDILTGSVHAAREIGEKNPLVFVFKKSNVQFSHSLDFLRQHACNVDGYNRSLHRNLAENFSKKFHGSKVADFARAEANPATFGREYFYDVALADRVLGHEVAWRGREYNGRQQGFDDEFARANVNLSLFDSERNLLKSWRVLATSLCDYVSEDASLQSELALTAARCLQTNAEANFDIQGMDEIASIRADMAFVLISKLVGAEVSNQAMKEVLPVTWDLIRSTPVNYDVATAAEDLRYYRTLLQILYLSIQPYVYMKADGHIDPRDRETRETDETKIQYLDPDVAATFVQIVERVIATGFRALCGNLHNDIDMATPADFALLTAILQAILSVHGIDAVHPQIANVIASSSLVRGALSLYSWADQPAEVMGQDPVYGEVGINFLLALSSLRPVAEQMAVEGALVQLSSANLSNYFRKLGGKGPFDEPRRMFGIWTEGFLPLCLNLLDAVGPAIAADISAFLNEFPEQLSRAETSLENVAPSLRNPHAGAITLGLVSEASSLCLLGRILESDTARGAADGINSAEVPKLEFVWRKVREDVAGLVRQRTSLASRIVAVGEREEEWRSLEAPGSGVDNVLMKKVLGVIEGIEGLGE